MMKITVSPIRLFQMLCLLLLSFNSHAARPADDLIKLLDNIKTMQASFTQVTYDNYQKPIQTTHGNVMLQRPGKFRWQVSKPIPQIIIANNGKLWIYDPDLEQVTIRLLSGDNSDAPALLLSHPDQTLDKTYVVKHLDEPGENVNWFLLQSKKEDSMFESIRMGFKGEQIVEMRLKDHLGHVTHIKFSKIKNNINIPAGQFIFKPKPGVDVIDESKQT